jgi:hypothetical protein
MYSRISSLVIPFRALASRYLSSNTTGIGSSSAPLFQFKSLAPQSVRYIHYPAGLSGTVKNIQQVRDAFAKQAAVENVDVLSLRAAKKFLHQLGFKRQGENYFGPKGMQAHVDMGTSKGHGEHLDLTQKGWEKIKIKVNPEVRFD